MKAVILAAGASRRLRPISDRRPKGLVTVGGTPILEHQLRALEAAGLHEVILVVGYRGWQIRERLAPWRRRLEIRYLENRDYDSTNTLYSLWLARRDLVGSDFVYLNGDVLFHPGVLHRVLAGTGNRLAIEVKPCGDEEVKVRVDRLGRIWAIGKEVDPGGAMGEFIGVARFSGSTTADLASCLDARVKRGDAGLFFESALGDLLTKHELHAVDIMGLPAIEIDYPEDLHRARTQVFPMICSAGRALVSRA